MKRYKLKDSVKNVLIISSLFLVVIVGSISIGKRNEQIEKQKMTEMNYQISHN